MGHGEFTRLQPFPTVGEGASTLRSQQRRRTFSRFELSLLGPLVLCALALAIFTIVYIFQHNGTVKPVAIVALCCTAILLLAVGFVGFQRLRRPDWGRDLETGVGKKWQISAPLLARGTPQSSFESTGTYTIVPDSRPQSRPHSPGLGTLSSKVRLAVKRTFSPSLLSRSSFESSASTEQELDDRKRLIPSRNGHRWADNGDERSSLDSSEDRNDGELWTSVFELAGDARLEELRQANLKRLSRESRRSRYEMSGWSMPAANKNEEDPGVTIVVTRPAPTASLPRSRRGSLSDVSNGDRTFRDVSLSFDPLRSNPIHLSRDSSIRQTRSSQDLTLLSSDRAVDPALRRPRSAEPRPDRSRLGYELVKARQHDRLNDRTTSSPSSNRMQSLSVAPRATPLSVMAVKQGFNASARAPRGLRKISTPYEVGVQGKDLRTVFQHGMTHK